MKINHLEIENWKCFDSKRSFDFNNHELITQQNGTGKTSIFQAILFAIYGKTPVGFNMNNIRNDDSKNCRVYIEFEMNGDNYKIERIFGNKNKAELNVNGQVVAESTRTIMNYIDQYIPWSLTNVLWTNSLIESEIVSINFVHKILDDILSNADKIRNYYKGEIYHLNRKINSFNEKPLDIDSIKFNLDEIEKQLKERIDDKVANKAKQAQEAAIWVQNNQLGENKLDSDQIRNYNRYKRQETRLRKQLESEEEKVSTYLSKFNKSALLSIIDYATETGVCPICGNEFSTDHAKELTELINNSGRDETLIQDLKNKLSYLNIDESLIVLNEQYEMNQKIVDSCPDYLNILEKFDSKNNDLWDQFNSLQRDYAEAVRQQKELEIINEQKALKSDYQSRLEWVDSWIKNATEYYTKQILIKSSEYLNNINSRYQQILLDDNVFSVIMYTSDGQDLIGVNIAQMSNGEKTIVALAMMFAIHNVILPEMPLLFDETFSALDRENLSQVQKFLNKQNNQIFVITHDKQWEEF